MKKCLAIFVLCALTSRATACIWDARTMFEEKIRSRDIAKVILGTDSEPINAGSLQADIKNLEANPDENNPEWWNNLAGAYIRLNQSATAAKLLESAVVKFPGDYGIHANLGTAYHLLGRYQEAEKEIARDLEINPDAHFGLEKYHLALLQYLVRDLEYQKRHVYVDEWSKNFLGLQPTFMGKPEGRLNSTNTSAVDPDKIKELENEIAKHPAGDRTVGQAMAELQLMKSDADVPPPYRLNWDLANDPKFKDGIIYMATLNPKQPACFVMIGIACSKSRDFNLAVAAFEKAIELRSPQSELLKTQIESLRSFINGSLSQRLKQTLSIIGVLSLILLVVMYYIYTKFRDKRRKVRSTI
jgi:hypothetical protein